MTNDNQDSTPNSNEEEEFVSVDAFVEMTARLLGRIQALEAMLSAALAGRSDTEAIARVADALLLNDEASRIIEKNTPQETMKTHEYAQTAIRALLADVSLARRINK